MIEGTDLKSASAGIPQQQVNWVVNLAFNGTGTDEFTQISRALVPAPTSQFAIVLDGQVHLRADHERPDHQRPGPDRAATSPRPAPRAWRPA